MFPFLLDLRFFSGCVCVCAGTVRVGSCRHTLVRTAFGQLFAWGQGVYGQLGVGQGEDVWAPKPIRTLQHVRGVPYPDLIACAKPV